MPNPSITQLVAPSIRNHQLLNTQSRMIFQCAMNMFPIYEYTAAAYSRPSNYRWMSMPQMSQVFERNRCVLDSDCHFISPTVLRASGVAPIGFRHLVWNWLKGKPSIVLLWFLGVTQRTLIYPWLSHGDNTGIIAAYSYSVEKSFLTHNSLSELFLYHLPTTFKKRQ